jgi:hypothetical protein
MTQSLLSHADNWLAMVVIGTLFISLLGLTVSLLHDALRLLLGVKLMIAVVILVGVPLTALVFAVARVL